MKIFLPLLFLYGIVLFTPYNTQAQCNPPITTVPTLKGPTSVSVGTSYSFCLGTTAVLNYYWSLSDGTVDYPGPSISKVISWSTAGTKTITVTSSDMCGNTGPATTFTINVVNQAALAAPTAITGPAALCQNAAGTYSVPAVSGMTPAWHVCYEPLIPTAPTLTPSGNNVAFTGTFPGTYTLYASYSNGTYTSPSRAVTITVKPTTLGTASIYGSNQACLNTSTVFVGGAPGADAVSWSLNDGGTLTPNGAQATVNWNKTGGPYQLTATASNSCTGATQTATFNVTVGPAQLATPTITPSSTQFCLNGTVTFTATPAGATSYTWTKTEPSGLTTNVTTAANTYAVTFYNGGTYNIKVTQSNGFCSSGAGQYAAVVQDRPTPSVTLPQKTGCLNTEYVITATDYPNHTYIWGVGDGTIIGDNNKSTIHVTWNSLGRKDIFVTAINPCGIGGANMLGSEFYIQPSSISLTDITGTTNVCPGNYTYVISAGLDASLITWQITPSGGGVITIPSFPYLPYNPGASINWTTPGTYTLKATATNGCGGSSVKTTTVTVSAGTKPNDVTISGPEVSGNYTGCAGTPYTFSVPAQSGVSFAWSAPDATLTPSGNTATVTWSTAGTKYVYVTPYNGSCQGNTVYRPTTVSLQPVGGTATAATPTVCSDASAVINLTGNTGYANWQYRSGSSPSNLSAWQPIASAIGLNTLNYTVTNTTSANFYYEFKAISSAGTNSNCSDATSTTASVTVPPLPVVSFPSGVIICSQQTVNLALSSSMPNTTFNWTILDANSVSGQSPGTGSSIQQVLTNIGPNQQGYVKYNIAGTANGCTGNVVTAQVTVQALPSITNTTAQLQSTICNNASFSFTPSVSPAGTTYAWTSVSSAGVAGASPSGTSTINNLLTNTGTGNGTVTYTIVPTASGCVGPSKNYVATVKPPVTIVAANKTICSGQGANVTLGPSTNTSFSWTVKQVNGNIFGPTSGTGATINNTLSNNNSAPGNVVYAVSSTYNGCNTITPVDVTVTVNPVATVNYTGGTTSICSGQLLSFTPTSATAGATFTYAVTSADPSISGYSSGTGAINQTLVNSGTTSAQLVYTITPAIGGCVGTPATKTVTVLPTAAAPSLTDKSICSGQSTAINLPSSAYSWTVKNATNVSGGAAGSGNVINQTLTATSATVAGTLTYAVVSTGGTCPSNPKDVTVTVNPLPLMTSPNIQRLDSICSGQSVNFTPAANISGSTFAYTASSSSGSITGFASGTGTISQTLTNTGAPGNVTYTITPTANGCAGATANYIVLVRSKIIASITGGNVVCFGTPNILRAMPVGYTYSWSTGATSQNISVTTAGTYTVTISRSGLCAGTASKTESVFNSPGSISQSGDLCTNGVATLSAPSGSSYSWSTGASSQSIMVFNPGTYSVNVFYTEGCQKSLSKSVILPAPPPGGTCGQPEFVANPEARPRSSEAEVSNDQTAETGNRASFRLHIQENPFRETLSFLIETPGEQQAQVRLIDLNGRVIHESTESTNALIGITPQVASQVLLLSVRTGQNQVVKRVVKID
ncbi:beta strand repeat-containing protein [Chryseolinea soli]|uniref:T9SS C-terminal target domain-containing protein n=1 Tax=Chryseolinea soli TaxID=2321403 RepID=A0A385SML2_9BACT|nr:PKD-like domain-containing protein [Chryseolinea soli]AYB32429.1 hypothetical protein D4L85_18440 [Chryseolinea soli]